MQFLLASNSSTASLSTLAISTGTAVSIGTFYNEILQTFFDLRWVILCICLLVITDFWSGLAASVKVRHEEFRFSRAGRRTLAKLAEYLSFIILGIVIAKSILEPFGICTYVTGGAVVATLCLLLEADSIYGHVCDLHGIHNRFSLKRLVVAYLKRKNQDLGEALEDTLEEAETKESESPEAKQEKK